jgi:monoamine oxidase
LALPRALFAQSRAQDVDVLIIGAGAAGFAAARELIEFGKSFRLVEARNRLGGRAFTDVSLGEPFDAGAFYIHWAESNPWTGIARELGVETVNDRMLSGANQAYMRGRRIAENERLRRRQAFEQLSAILDIDEMHVPDISFSERFAEESRDLQWAATATARLSLGEEPGRVSARDYARLWSSTDLVVPSGYGALIARFGERFDIALDTPVTSLRWDGPGVEAATPKGTIRAGKAIVTVPVGVLAKGGIRFIPELPASTQGAIAGLRMGALGKIALKFNGERFGLAPGTNLYEAESEGEIEAARNGLFNFDCWSFNRNLVVAMMGGDHSRAVAALGEAGAVAAALESFVKVVGEGARKHFMAGRLADWSRDPFAGGCYAHALPGHAKARAALSTPVGERIFFAGEATGGANFGGAMTAGGAYLSGQAAARAVAGG